MNPEKLLANEYKKALKEIGEIKPWWSEEDQLYVFEHKAYPVVDYLAKTPEEVIEKYQLVLQDFIAERLNSNIAEPIERITSGRGGSRPGAGRPKGTTKPPTLRKRLPADIARWLDDEANHEKVRKLM